MGGHATRKYTKNKKKSADDQQPATTENTNKKRCNFIRRLFMLPKKYLDKRKEQRAEAEMPEIFSKVRKN